MVLDQTGGTSHRWTTVTTHQRQEGCLHAHTQMRGERVTRVWTWSLARHHRRESALFYSSVICGLDVHRCSHLPSWRLISTTQTCWDTLACSGSTHSVSPLRHILIRDVPVRPSKLSSFVCPFVSRMLFSWSSGSGLLGEAEEFDPSVVDPFFWN